MSPAGPTPERVVALNVLRRVADGAYADRAFAGEAQRASLTGPQRAQAHRLSFGAVQRRRTLDWLIDAKVRNPAALEAPIRDILRLVTYEMLWSDSVPVPVSVDQAVRLAAQIPGAARRIGARRGVVNAVARAVAVDGATRLAGLGDDTWERAAVRHSMPDWIARALVTALGHDLAVGAMTAANAPSESVLRWNALRGGIDDLAAQLPPAAVRCAPPFEDAFTLPGAFALEDSQIWREGRVMAQSRASMLPVLAMGVQPGERVLDLCAAPGAKASYLAAKLGGTGEIVAVEANSARARSLTQLADRMGAPLRVVEGDGREVPLDGGFDAVLVDPPCSGLGVLGVRPDARWRRTQEDVGRLAQLQGQLLARALELVAPTGRVVYSTCTLLPAENDEVVRASGASIDDITHLAPEWAHRALAGALLTVPGRDGTDGFFVARLRPQSSS